jgi:hypothetical protein
MARTALVSNDHNLSFFAAFDKKSAASAKGFK